MKDPNRGESSRAPIFTTVSFDKEVESILAHRVVPRRGVIPSSIEYLVKWKGHPYSEASWEREESLWQFMDKIVEFQEVATRASPN